MANCNEFQELTPKEKTEYIGELVHSCLNDAQLYVRGLNIIKLAKSKGIMDGVKINPAPPLPEHTIDNLIN